MLFFKNRKSRKQLLKEIEELVSANESLSQQLLATPTVFVEHRNIIPVQSICIAPIDMDEDNVKKTLCRLLAESIAPYVTYETYRLVSIDPRAFENKWYAKINIIKEN